MGVDLIRMHRGELEGYKATNKSVDIRNQRRMTPKELDSWCDENIQTLPEAINQIKILTNLCMYLLHGKEGKEHFIIDKTKGEVIPIFAEPNASKAEVK